MTRTYLEQDQILRIFDAVPLVSKHPEQDLLLLRLLWESGARVTEAITLIPEHIGDSSVVLRNLKQYKIIKVNGKKIRVHDKNAIKEVQVSEELCQNLKLFMPGREFVFMAPHGKKHVSAWYVWNMLTRVSEVAGIRVYGKRNPRTGGRFKGAYPHLFRHSNAMKLLEETKDISLVQQQLGHADVKTTQGYAYVTAPRIKKAVGKIDWYKRGEQDT